jgi:acetyl esterase/lipase
MIRYAPALAAVSALAALAASMGCASPGSRSPLAGAAISVRVVRDLVYSGSADDGTGKNRLDLYLPEGKTSFPVLVSLHGGALLEGDKNGQAFVGEAFASAGIGTAVVNYHLSPQVSHPRHVQDAAASVAWVKKHIRDYGGDPDQVFVTGHSAGAYLAALLAVDARYLQAEGLSPRDVRGFALVSGFFWVERVAPDRPKSVWGNDEAAWIDASPAHKVGPAVPPTLLLYADGDDPWRRQQNVEMAGALRAAGNSQVAIAEIAGRDHGSIWAGLATPGDDVAERIRRFIEMQVVQGSPPATETHAVSLAVSAPDNACKTPSCARQ